MITIQIIQRATGWTVTDNGDEFTDLEYLTAELAELVAGFRCAFYTNATIERSYE